MNGNRVLDAVFLAAAAALASACSPGLAASPAEPGPSAVPEAAEVVLPAAGAAAPRWAEATHRTLSSIAAAQWGLSAGRIAALRDAAADDPDSYQAGLDNAYNQQWSHAYIYDDWFGSTFWLWGDADDDFHDNIEGPEGGEGFEGLSAGYWYARGAQAAGDRNLGCALHYIEDVSLVLHSTAPDSSGITVPYVTTDMATKHSAFEGWIAANANAGHRLLDAVAADPYYYAVTDTRQAVRNAAWASCAYKGKTSVGYSAWKAYRDSGYPTGAGTGSAALADATRKMLVSAARYAKGAIKYALDAYGQWESAY